jgi:alcohol dehydrogenase (cytochrome c)
MTGEMSGDFVVLAAATGEQLYKRNVGGAIGGGVITYEASGRQFIAVAAGNTNPVYETNGDNTIVVLGLR